jgi:hypothetical protein
MTLNDLAGSPHVSVFSDENGGAPACDFGNARKKSPAKEPEGYAPHRVWYATRRTSMPRRKGA